MLVLRTLPMPTVHTDPGNVSRQTQQPMKRKMLKDISWISTTNESVLGHKNDLQFSFPLPRGYLCWLPLINPSSLALASVPRISLVGWGCWQMPLVLLTFPFLEVNTHFLYGASPFCQQGKWRSQPGYLKWALSDTFWNILSFRVGPRESASNDPNVSFKLAW